ncbi:MAG: hypothetical protein A2046_01215 [Bacteroidetes bacterium GWA2_30_7]|nr:MAG: hypothetical protein A2046_01215 [Bacteroidetes bacterium GWA2_30_7]
MKACKLFKVFTLIIIILISCNYYKVFSQVLLVNPAAEGGFENGTAFADNGWTVVNGTINMWYLGTATIPSGGGIRTAYISNDGAVTNAYGTGVAKSVHFYRSVTVPAGATNVNLSFLLKSRGEQTDWDQLLVCRGSGAITAGTPNSTNTSWTGYTNIFTQNSTATWSSYQTVNLTSLAGVAGTTFNLVFNWKNDGNSSGIQPPASVDNISLSYVPSGVTANATVGAPASQISAGDINSTATSSGTAVDVFKFKITDPGTVDAFASKVTQVQIKKSSGTADWSDQIAGAELWDGVSQITTGTPVITDADITFPITSGNLNIASGTNKDITLKIWLNSSNIVDNSTMVFKVDASPHGFFADVSSSTAFQTTVTAVTGNTMTVRVTATKLIFTTQPSATCNTNTNLVTQAVVKATDNNGNTDINRTDNVTVTNSGTLGMVNTPASLTAGVCTFPANFQFTQPGTVTITVAENPSAGFTDATSSSIEVKESTQWAKSYQGTSEDNDNGYCIVKDASNNIYIGGAFRTTVDADPSAGTYNLTVSGSTQAAFFSKHNEFGELVWSKKINSASGENIIQGITIDGSGNIYITGQFQGNNFDVDLSGTVTASDLSSAGSNDIFYAKYDNNGNYVWAYRIGGTGSDYGKSIALDGSNNVYITGWFSNVTVDFNPSGTTNDLTNSGGADIFYAKYDNNGSYQWAQKIGGTSDDYSQCIKVDAGSNNVFICGSFKTANVDFDPSGTTNSLSTTGSGDEDGFVAKYSTATGAYQWAFKIGGGASATDDEIVQSLVLDASDNVYITGKMMYSTIDFDPSPAKASYNLTTIGSVDCFYAKYSSASALTWAKNIGTAGNTVYGNGLFVSSNDLYIVGYFTGTIDFDPDAGTENRTAVASVDMFFSQYNSSDGSFLCKGSVGGSGIDYANDVVGGSGSGSFQIIGWFSGTDVEFDPLYSSTKLSSGTAGGYSDIFIASYFNFKVGGTGCVIGLPVELLNFNAKLNNNNIDVLWTTASEYNNDYFQLERSYDGINYEYLSKIDGAGNSNSILDYYHEDKSVDFNNTVVYYKLIQYDFDGRSHSYFTSCKITNTYNNIIKNVRFNNEENDLEILLNSNNDSELKIKIQDIRGSLLNQKTIDIIKGNNKIELNFNYLNSGVYLVTISFNNNIETKKFIKY